MWFRNEVDPTRSLLYRENARTKPGHIQTCIWSPASITRVVSEAKFNASRHSHSVAWAASSIRMWVKKPDNIHHHILQSLLAYTVSWLILQKYPHTTDDFKQQLQKNSMASCRCICLHRPLNCWFLTASKNCKKKSWMWLVGANLLSTLTQPKQLEQWHKETEIWTGSSHAQKHNVFGAYEGGRLVEV